MDPNRWLAEPSGSRGGPVLVKTGEPQDALRHALQEAFTAGRLVWPGATLAADAFASWVQAGGITEAALLAHGADLYLAAACTAGDDRAIEHFDRRFLQAPGPAMGRMVMPETQLDEVRQQLRVRLLSGPVPRISKFQGQGPMAAWVRVAAARVAADLKRSDPMGASGDDALISALVHAGADPEALVARREHQLAFRAALHEAVAGLTPREKTLLRMSALDGMTIDDIKVIYRVHRATVARWLVALRQSVFERVCKRLSIKLRSSPSEVASLVRLARSQLDLSLSKLLVSVSGDQQPSAPAEGKTEGEVEVGRRRA
jgi:RNA polymerase sigma-70 factor (ECF subfamily)